MTAYLDTVAVPLLVDDDHAPRARAWAASGPDVAISPSTLAEFSSALSRLARMNRYTESDRLDLKRTFDGWTRQARMLDFEAERFVDARRQLQKHDRLRAPDALHLAIVLWSGLELATLDGVMRDAAIAEGVEVIDL